jgi:hypothetical protein
MKTKRINATLRLMLAAIALAAACKGGVMSGGVLLTRLSNEVELHRLEIQQASEITEAAEVRAKHKIALLLAPLMHRRPVNGITVADVPRSRIRELSRRLDRDVQRRIARRAAPQ